MQNNVSPRRPPNNSPILAFLLLCLALIACALMLASDYASERDAYRRFEHDVSAALECVRSARVTHAGYDRAQGYRCSVHAMSLSDAVNNVAIQHERDRVLHLSAVVRVALDSSPPNETVALDALIELERLSRPR